MGGAVFYFTSGVVLRCERAGSAQPSCTEGRRIFGLVDIPVHRFPVVLGAGFDDRQAYDDDGDEYTASVPVVVTPAGREPLAPFGAGEALGDAIRQVDAFAKDPKAERLSVGGQAWGAVFLFHLFSSLFIFIGVSNIVGYAVIRLRRGRA
jgi:hypothetical protein